MSFTPRDRSDWRTFILGGFRVQLLQKFGQPPSEADLNEKIHVCWPSYLDGHTPFSEPLTTSANTLLWTVMITSTRCMTPWETPM